MNRAFRLRSFALLLVASTPALAHDTWFHREARDASGRWTLSLGTGNQYPVLETPLAVESLQLAACRQADESAQALQPLRALDQALQLRTPPATGGLSCWAQSLPFELELPPDKIAVYLKEIHASPAVHAAWAGMRGRGLPWKERYAKHARIELPGTQARRAAAPGMAMDAVPLGEPAGWRRGDTASFQLLRDGQPLAGLAVEFRHERAPMGFWRITDAQGHVQTRLPLAGRWVLRGTDLRPSSERPGTWDSRFITLAFDVAAPMDQNGSSLSSNALSANHSAASTAMADEPPTNTPRW
jgi:hypothetical protein